MGCELATRQFTGWLEIIDTPEQTANFLPEQNTKLTACLQPRPSIAKAFST
jgi:hypothetical protein